MENGEFETETYTPEDSLEDLSQEMAEPQEVKHESTYEEIDDNEELKPEPTGRFINKNVILEKSIVILPKKLSKGKFGKNLSFTIAGKPNEEWLIDLNKTNFNWLLENLGNKVSLWKNKRLLLSAERFENTIRGDSVKGITITFELDN